MSAPWVNASDVGNAAYCPVSLYLKKKGAPSNRQAQRSMQVGNQAHEVLARRAVQAERRCYVSTHAFGADHPVTQALRAWRDRELRHRWYGKPSIKIYERLSPLLVRLAMHSSAVDRLLKTVVLWFSARIGKKG